MESQNLMQTIVDRVQSKASVKTIFGDPISAPNKTIVPVAKVRYGFGAGGWRDPSSAQPPQAPVSGDGAQAAERRAGGGGGGGVMVVPAGVVEITEERTTFVPIGVNRQILAALLAGAVAGFLLGRRR